MNNCNSIYILIKTGCFIKMSKFDDQEKVDFKFYQQLIEKLINLLYSTRSNITFAIDQLSKYNADPRIGYMRIAKKIVQYLKSIIYIYKISS